MLALPRAVVFDLDGVLVRSDLAHHEAYRRTFGAEGRSFPFDEYRVVARGRSRAEVIEAVLGSGLGDRLPWLMAEKERHMVQLVADGAIQEIDGASGLLPALQAAGHRVGVATTSRTPELLLGGVGLLGVPDVVASSREVERPKPAPDVYLLALARLGLRADEAIAVEDSAVGIEAALAAGLRTYGLSTTEPPDELRAAAAVFPGLRAFAAELFPHVGPLP